MLHSLTNAAKARVRIDIKWQIRCLRLASQICACRFSAWNLCFVPPPPVHNKGAPLLFERRAITCEHNSASCVCVLMMGLKAFQRSSIRQMREVNETDPGWPVS